MQVKHLALQEAATCIQTDASVLWWCYQPVWSVPDGPHAQAPQEKQMAE